MMVLAVIVAIVAFVVMSASLMLQPFATGLVHTMSANRIT